MGEAKRRQARGDSNPRAGARPKGPWLLAGGLLLLLLLVAALLYWLTNPAVAPTDDLPRAEPGAPAFPADLDRYGVSLGDPNAPVVVREFADYQCPACANFAEQLQRLKTDYIDTGKLRVVFFDFPLSQHVNAMPAALAARCAGDQGAYWPMNQRLFAAQSSWEDLREPRPLFVDYARDLGLDAAAFESCLTSERHRPAVQRSLEAARQLRVASTPTVYVDNVLLTRPGWYQLAGVVQRQLQAAGR